MRGMVEIRNGGLPPLAPTSGAQGSMSRTRSAQGTTRYNYVKKMRLHVVLVTRQNIAVARLLCFMRINVWQPRLGGSVE